MHLLSTPLAVNPGPAPGRLASSPARIWPWTGLVALAASLLWCYWPTLLNLAERWSRDPQYSHGFLVPLFALVILWYRRPREARSVASEAQSDGLRPALGSSRSLPLWSPSWWGLPLLLAGVAMRLTAVRMDIEFLDGYSLLVVLAGLTWLVGGGSMLRWAWPAVAFLAFMVPVPFQLEMALAQPLRRLATLVSTYLLQTLGYPAIADGNIILIDEVKLGVADACSGLGMLVTFAALATAMAMVIPAPLLDRLVLVAAGAVPVALVVNVIRITATGVAYVSWSSDVGHAIMHDLAGWLMMPLALGLLWLEYLLLQRLLVPVDDGQPLPLTLGQYDAPGALPAPGGLDASRKMHF